VRGGIDAVDLLESICEAHQAGCVPHPAQVPKSERTIVEAAAGTEAYAAAIETYQRDKHHIEPAGAKRLTALRLGNSQSVVLQGTLHGHETHGARGAPAIDARQEDAAAPLRSETDERRGVQLPGKRCIGRNAPVVPQLQGAIEVARDESRELRALLRWQLAAARIEARPQRFAGGTQ